LDRRTAPLAPAIDLDVRSPGTLNVLDARAARGLARLVSRNIVATRSMMPLRFPSPRVALSMMWRRRFDNHPAERWLRGNAVASVTGE
jgi:hypothetical protein